MWVKQLFDGFHGFVGVISPFMADKGSHIPARAMLGFQGTVIFIYYQGLDVIHQVFVAFHFRLGTEGLVDDEVVVAFESMAVDAGVIISVAGYELLQFCRCLRKVFNVEGDVFDEASGSRLACPPTEGKMPERMAQYLEYSSGRSVKRTGI